MSYEVVYISGPTLQKDRTYLTVIAAKGDDGKTYDVVSAAKTDSSVTSAIKALCARRNKAGVHCFCGYDKPPATKTLTVS